MIPFHIMMTKSGIIELDVDVVVLFHPFNPPSTSPYFIASA